MSLQFVLGPSGYGKSTYVRNLVTKEASLHRERNFFLIVPDQFTMQTQMTMAKNHPDGGILNIDVLSFGRLTHRIFEEVGKPDLALLDDLGKCLILRRVIHDKEDELRVLKKGIHTPGYVQEVKSVLSEFMQYGIRPKELKEWIGALTGKDGEKNTFLIGKLQDFLVLYEGFEEALADQYTTKEETLYCLSDRIPLSAILKRSVIVFDGFTGFTPLQVRVIRALMENADEVIVTLPLGYAECRNKEEHTDNGYQDLFHLTKKTIRDLTKEATEAAIGIKESIRMTDLPDLRHRFGNAPAISRIEKNLFRKDGVPYEGPIEEIVISKTGDETHECMVFLRQMTDLIRRKGYRYRDMAVVCGNMEAYEDILKVQFEKYKIPYFMDTTTSLIQNPFVATLRLLLIVLTKDFVYRDVLGLLKGGFLAFTREETDLLDNYILARNIRGKSAWKRKFKASTSEMRRKYASMEKEAKDERIGEELNILNDIRSRFVSVFEPFDELLNRGEVTAREWLVAFYRLIEKEDFAHRLSVMADEMEENGEPAKALEYRQVYKAVMKLFDQVVNLIGEEILSLEELSEVLDVGFGEIRIGIIPKSVDVLPVCDMIRSRFGEIKALFFIGVNDGSIPKTGSGGGLLSDMDRSNLMASGMDLAPNRAMENFTEQLYLYQVLTKPSERLYLSYLSVTETGESKKPSYLIRELRKLFLDLTETDEIANLEKWDTKGLAETLHAHNLLNNKDLRSEFAACLSEYVSGAAGEEKREYTKALYAVIKANPSNIKWLDGIVEKAFESYRSKDLDEKLVRKVYGDILKCSVSSLEKFSGCAYSHFLQFGLRLRERETMEIYSADLGNITHGALEAFGKYLLENHEEFVSVSDEKCAAILDEITDRLMEEYEAGLFIGAEDEEYLSSKVKRILRRSAKALKNQLSKGRFRPVRYEQKFDRLIRKDEVMLNGKIDRIDSCEEGDTAYIKIVDYKSGSRDFDEKLFAQGVQLQTAVYLSEAVKRFATEHPEMRVKPAAMLYFRMQDPMVEVSSMDTETIEKTRDEMLRPTGIFVGDDSALDRLETERTIGKSVALPVSYNADGTLSKRSTRTYKTEEEMKKLLDEADEKVQTLSSGIAAGRIDVSPLIFDKYNACTYCPFKTACGFDERLSGYARRVPEGEKGETSEDDD